MEINDRSLDAVTLGHTWAEERAATLRDRVPAEQWPDSWDDAYDGPLPTDADPSTELRLRMTASSAAHVRWRALVAEQRSSEACEREQRVLDARVWPRARAARVLSRGE